MVAALARRPEHCQMFYIFGANPFDPLPQSEAFPVQPLMSAKGFEWNSNELRFRVSGREIKLESRQLSAAT